MSESNSESSTGTIIGTLSSLFLMLAGIFYASGYMVIFTASQRLGIIDTGEEIFKCKYIQVGAYCDVFILFLACVGYIASAIRSPNVSTPQSARPFLDWRRYVLLFLFLLGLLLQGILVPAGNLSWALALAMIAYLALALTVGLFDLVQRPWVLPVLSILALLIVLSCCALRFHAEYNPWFWKLFELSPHRSTQNFLGIILLSLLCIFIGRIAYIFQHPPIPHKNELRWVWYAATVPLLVFGLFDTIVGFAVIVYPYIPIDKGGGNYGYARAVMIQTSEGNSEPDTAEPGTTTLTKSFDTTKADTTRPDSTTHDDNRYIVLLETSDYLYVAKDSRRSVNSDNDDSPDNWGKLGGNPPRNIRQIPLAKITVIDCTNVTMADTGENQDDTIPP